MKCKFKTNSNYIPDSYTTNYFTDQIQHGRVKFLDNIGKVLNKNKTHYLVQYTDKFNKIVQLAFPKEDIILLKNRWL